MGSPRRQPWAADRGLEVRMVLVMLLLAALYVGLVAALVVAGASAAIVFAAAALFALGQVTLAERLALQAIGARVVTPTEQPEAHAALDRICMMADAPKPRLAIADSELANALAVGRSRKSATVCVTTRALELLDRGELEAVLAHELAHLENRDAVVMTVAGFFSMVSALVLRFGLQVGIHLVRGAAIVVALVSWSMSFVLLSALSRYRELAADRSAALVTGRPSALASALVKLDADSARVPKKDLRAAASVAALCITAPRVRSGLARLVATHPSTESRIAALERLEARLQRN